jgi:hypothetical protein
VKGEAVTMSGIVERIEQYGGATTPPANQPTHRDYLNDERTILVTMWSPTRVTIAFREHVSDTWGPPISLHPEKP